MFHDTENMFELLRDMPTAVCFLMIIPLVLISTTATANASNEFPVFRMQQYDLQGIRYGSRGAAINLEARSLMSENLIRRCAVVKGTQLHLDQLKKAVEDGLSALLILFPSNLETKETLQHLEMLEEDLMAADLPIPVYFAEESERLLNLYNEITQAVNADTATSAFKAMTTVASANSFHFVTDGGDSKAMNDFSIVSIQGKLTGNGLEDQLPTVAIVTHYDTFGVVPKLSKGADSNGSGVVALMELARLFSLLFNDASTRPKYNLLFLLAGGGKFNYQGTKKWIEDNVESSEISLLAEADYVLCIDSIGQGSDLNLHVSKPPKQGSQAYLLIEEFKMAMSEFYPQSTFGVLHKKVNLADDVLAWEHERFSMRRLPAGTFSHFSKPYAKKGSILDTKVDSAALERNIKVIAEGLSRHVFNMTGQAYSKKLEVFTGYLAIDRNHINAWSKHLFSEPRSQQLISKEHRLLAAMEDTLSQYLNEVHRFTTRADKKDPEFVFYNVFEAKMNVYSVKPALFDLLLAMAIASYLGLTYLFVENFALITELLPTMQQKKKIY